MSQKIPRHVAIVMDGNGRWAEHLDLPRIEGHKAGVNAVNLIVQSCLEKNISILSLFAFSCENWSRPEEEVEFLMQLFILSIQREIDSLCENGVCLRFIGDRERLSAKLREQMHAAEEMTRHNQQLNLNIAVNYSGQWDIVQAAKKLASRVAAGELALNECDEKQFAAGLSTYGLSDPDLLIRTSGEQRISNFFLWQLAYTELYFTDVKWPAFTVNEFERALNTYAARERRYGLTSEQIR